jgi:tripartite-type tricarboxylate transporter receptor subunit TctC
MRKNIGRLFLVSALAVAVVLTFGGFAAAKVDFAGKTVSIIVPFGVGGGTDVSARVYAPYFTKYLPGNPVVMVENVAGGGGIVGANHFQIKGKPDGLQWFFSSGSVTFPMMFGMEGVRYNYNDWEIIFAQPVGAVVYTRSDSGIKTPMDLKGYTKQMHFASSGPASVDHCATISLNILGIDVTSTHGYEGSGARRVANEQGEANIDYQTTPAYLKNVIPLIKMGTFIPLYSYGSLNDEAKIVRQPEAPELPTFKEVYLELKGVNPEGQTDFEAWKALFLAGIALQKPAFLPAGTPKEIVEVYQDAVRKMREDPEFQKDMESKLGGYAPLVGDTARKALREMMDISPDTKGWITKWFKEHNDLTINFK